MRSLSFQLKFLILLLLFLGIGIICYQIFIENRPLTENKVENNWTIDLKLDFTMNFANKANVELLIPPKKGMFNINDELFVSSDYGQNISEDAYNRLVTWSNRKVSGVQTLFYRANVTRSNSFENTESEIPENQFIEPIKVNGLIQKTVDEITKSIRKRSTNTKSFITTAINTINDPSNVQVKLLLGNDNSTEQKIQILKIILSQARIGLQEVHTLKLEPIANGDPMQLWIRSYILPEGEEAKWFYFNPETAQIGLPENQMIWWIGDEQDIASLNNDGNRVKTTFSITTNDLTSKQLMTLISNGGSVTDVSFYNLPISSQEAYKIMLMIPFGVLVILLLRNVIGIQTLGTFTPVLIALAFEQTGLQFGIIFFVSIVFFGLLLRSYLEHLKLQMLPRLSIVLTFVVGLIVFFGLISYKLDFQKGLTITLFPMVILTMTIERLSITWEERGANNALKIAIGTLITAAFANYLMEYPPLVYFVFTFPAILLILSAFMLLMGRYNGYRLMELKRFKALMKKSS